MRNKKILALLLSILVVIILCIFLIPQAKLLTMGETVKVYFPKDIIKKSTEITSDMLIEKEMPKIYISEVVSSKDEIIGKISKSDIYKTDYITNEKLAKEDERAIYEKSNLISISTTSIPASVSGYIRVGDKVNVYAKDIKKQEGSSPIPQINNLEVAALVDATGANVKFDENNSSSVITSVVLKVPNEDIAKNLINMEAIGGLHLERVGK